jgi:hypothetical protein
MNINTAFPSEFIKSADLGRHRVKATIESVSMAKVGKDDEKPVVYFKGKEKGLVLNKTNASMIAEIAGSEETDEWEGVQIVMYVTKVEYAGKRMDGIRVDYPADKQPPAPPIETDNGSDDIPF